MVAQAEENYSLAEGRYRTGVGDSLALSDALLALTDARLSVYRARYDLQVAQFALEPVITNANQPRTRALANFRN